MIRHIASLSALGLGLVLSASFAGAVCLDPKDPTLTTYYSPSLKDELSSSDAVVVATVIDVQALAEDASDPDGWTSFVYKARIEEVLKGKPPAEVVLRAQNDSGGYRMSLGEKHLLLLTREGESFRAASCGNSTTLPKGTQVLEALRKLLAEARHAV